MAKAQDGGVSGTGLLGVCPGTRQINWEVRKHWKASTTAAAVSDNGQMPVQQTLSAS